MAGGSTPVNLAGALVVHNCEALAGLVLAQTGSAGAKFIYGSSSTAMDLRYGAAVVGTPELAVLNAGVAAMARWLLKRRLRGGRIGGQQMRGCPERT